MRSPAAALLIIAAAGSSLPPLAFGQQDVTREQVENAIRDGVRFLLSKQNNNGSWSDVNHDVRTGTTSLAALALLNAGQSPQSREIANALGYLRDFTSNELDSTYAVSLRTMVFAAAEPDRDRLLIQDGVTWLERAQFKPADNAGWVGSWTYHMNKSRHGDNSNSQYALLGLYAASEVGVPVNEQVWTFARAYWEQCQNPDGSFPYVPNDRSATASMTCAGISSLVITGLKRVTTKEILVGDQVRNCGEGALVNPRLQAALNWMGRGFQVGQNVGQGQNWKYYYLYGLERAGRLSGVRYMGGKDWYRQGARELVAEQDPVLGSWRGTSIENDEVIATSLALLFLAKGRSPVLVNKLRHGPEQDWDIHFDDVRNLTSSVSRDWKSFLTWQVVDPAIAKVEDLLQAPICFVNGKQAPEFSDAAKKNLRNYVEQGGFIFAEAGCSDPKFDEGFRKTLEQIFPEPDYKLKKLPEDHPVWRARYDLTPEVHELWGIDFGCRTVVIYTPKQLAAYWNHAEQQPGNPAVVQALRVGQNVVDYATGRELPADKLTVREVKDFKADTVRRGALRIAKLRHAGDWNVAPLAIPNLTTALRDTLGFDVVISHKELFPRDENLVYYPLIYIHGRASLSFSPEDQEVLKRHIEPGGGTFFADAACGSEPFDAGFRKLCKALYPDNPLVPIPPDDDIYTTQIGYDLSKVQYTKAAGGREGRAELEGIKIGNRWAVIYSKYDLGCALERHQGLDCKGYNYESALKIATNIVIYSTLP